MNAIITIPDKSNGPFIKSAISTDKTNKIILKTLDNMYYEVLKVKKIPKP